MSARYHEKIGSYFYNPQHPHYDDVRKFDMVKGAIKGAHSVTTTIGNIIWPIETTTESATVDKLWPVTEDPNFGVDNTINLNKTVMGVITDGTQDTMVTAVNNIVNVTNEISNPTTLPNVIQNAVNSMVNLTVMEPQANMTSGIDNTINLNETVMGIITDGTQDTMVNAVNNIVNVTSEIANPTTLPDMIQNAVNSMVNLTVIEPQTNLTAGIDNTINLNETVMGIITDGTQDTMVNAVNNIVNVTNEISNPTTLPNMIQNAVNSMVNLTEITPPPTPLSEATANVTNQVQMIPTTIANVVKNTTNLITDTISTTAKNIGSEYFHVRDEHEGSQKGTNSLLVLILLVLIFIGGFLIYLYIRHQKIRKTRHEYKVNEQQEETSTNELQHEQIQIENENYVQHKMT